MWAAKRADKTWVDEQIKGTVAALGSLEALLQGNDEARASASGGGGDEGGLWLGGRGWSHADASMFGLYCWTLLSPELKTGVWESEKLPHIQKWLEGMKKRFVKSEDELY